LQGIVEGLTSRTVVSASAPWREPLLLASFVVPRGIWRPVFRRLGASVTLLARNPVALDSVKAMLTTGESQHHHVLVADFNRPDSLKAVLDGYLAQTSPVHILVNTSGGPPPGLAC
jgi:NAD(P)-dependent dehydrogenase (short-subunit alcohol dehydrogenase family)